MPSDSPKRAKMAPATEEPAVPLKANVSVSGDRTVPAGPLSLRIKLLSEHGRAPQCASPGAAGYDIFSAQETTISARGRALIATDISLDIPAGHYGRVAPRSGLALKYGIDVGAGVIDSDYRGPLGIVLFNFGDADFAIKRGDRIAQLLIEPIAKPAIAVVTELDATGRGHGGFGSTGK